MTDLTPAPDAPVGVLDRPAELDAPARHRRDAAPAARPGRPGPRRGRVARFVRGKESDAPWVRPALLALLVATAVLYSWDLGASGWGNSFYSAAVQAGTKSWKAFFFGSSDSSNFITVDKPPAFLWPMEISARIFGLNSWSVLAPQALEGVATVGLVYLSVRRWFSAQAAILGGAVVALTPVAALMFRYNNPDAMLAMLLAGALYATMRGLGAGTDQVARPGRDTRGFRLHHQDDAGLLDPPGDGGRVPLGRARRDGGAGCGQVCLMGLSAARRGRLVGRRRRPHTGGRSPLRRRVAGQQHLEPHLRLQRLRTADRQRDRQRGRRQGRREHVGTDRDHPALQHRVREHDVVAVARRRS